MLRSLLIIVGFALVVGPVQAEDWPQWRGPRGDGIAKDTKVQTKWSKTENVRWRTPMPGQGGATPVVADGQVYVTSAEGSDLVLLCLAAQDGKLLWKQTVTSGNQDARAGEGNSASPSPSTDGKHVWVFFGNGVLACYDKQGKEVWKFNVSDRFGKIDIQFGMTSTPVLDGNYLYLQLIHGPMRRDDNTRTGKVIKLDKLTGNTVWEVDRETAVDFECKHSYASPFLYRDSQRQFLVAHGADCVTGHDLQTGTEIWRLDQLNGPAKFNKKNHDATFRFVASPAVVPGWIIVPTAKEGPTVALEVNGDLKGAKVADSSAVRWSIAQTPDVSIPLVVDGLVYNLHKDGRLQCLDLKTGEQLYFERTHTSQHRTSPVLAGGNIYFSARDGVTTVVKPGRTFERIAENDLGEAITASPAVVDGVLFMRTYDALYAIQ